MQRVAARIRRDGIRMAAAATPKPSPHNNARQAGKKVDREAAWAEKKAREAQAKQRRKGRATDITPAAVVANGVPIPEDHRFEQFFYDAPTSSKMMRLVRRFEKPLLVCVPSIAARLDANGEDYLLLDRDERFSTLRHYEPFDLRSPKKC